MKTRKFLAVLLLPGLCLCARSAAASGAPAVSNVSDVSFTLSWVTAEPAAGSASYGPAPDALAKTAYDERGAFYSGRVHHVRVTGLAPGTTWYARVSGGEEILRVVTAPSVSPPMPEQVFGPVRDGNGNPAAGALVVATPRGPGGEAGAPLTCLVDGDGWWSLNLGNARTADLEGFLAVRGGVARLELAVQPAAGGPALIFEIFPALARPAPLLDLGR